MKIIKQLCLPFMVVAMISCSDTDKADMYGEWPLKFSRLDSAMFNNTISGREKLFSLRAQFGTFADLYLKQIIGLRAENDTALAAEVDKYVQDQYIKDVYKSVAAKYKDLNWLRKDLSVAFGRYHYYFPDNVIPGIITYIAPFNYNAVASDSVLAIGLDMYLGNDYDHYKSAGFPLYKINKLRKEYILTDAVTAWVQSDYEDDAAKNDLLNNMINEGKILFCVDKILPGVPDTIKFGYSKIQLEWCRQNEKNIWQFFIEQKLLFNNNPGEYIKYINDGAGTGGFPKEAPARLGAFIGYRIVESYMDNHEINIPELMNKKNGNELLIESEYKPKR